MGNFKFDCASLAFVLEGTTSLLAFTETSLQVKTQINYRMSDGQRQLTRFF